MIHYHGTPMGGPNDRAAESLSGRHALISFAAPAHLEIVCEVCQSFCLDNGAFTAWKSGNPITNWQPYYEWVAKVKREPSFDFAIIPDVIDGTEEEQDRLVEEWPFGRIGVPVWHMNESPERLQRLCREWPRVAIGSTGEFKTVGSENWWIRIREVFPLICENGQPITKLHGLRMLNPKIFTQLPLSSADSSSVALNSCMNTAWKGTYAPPVPWRARILMARVEAYSSARRWE